MKALLLICVLLMTSGCDRSTSSGRHTQLDCGVPIVDIQTTQPQGRVIIGGDLASWMEQQLPKGVLVDAGCWIFDAGGALQGEFLPRDPKVQPGTIYIFERRDNRWTLVHTETIIENPYGRGDSVR